jgi:hypothetical protein
LNEKRENISSQIVFIWNWPFSVLYLPTRKKIRFFIPKRAKNLENSNLSPAGKKGNLPNLQSCTKIKTEKHCSLNFFFVLLVPI